MRFGVVASIMGIKCPMFLDRDGYWVPESNKMETFPTIKEALEAAHTIVTENVLMVRVEFSGYLRKL